MSIMDSFAHAARFQARQRFKFMYFAETWIFSESSFIGKKYILRLIVKELFQFEVLSVTDARAARSRCRYALNPQCIPELFTDFEREWSGLKKMIKPKIVSLKLSL